MNRKFGDHIKKCGAIGRFVFCFVFDLCRGDIFFQIPVYALHKRLNQGKRMCQIFHPSSDCAEETHLCFAIKWWLEFSKIF